MSLNSFYNFNLYLCFCISPICIHEDDWNCINDNSVNDDNDERGVVGIMMKLMAAKMIMCKLQLTSTRLSPVSNFFFVFVYVFTFEFVFIFVSYLYFYLQLTSTSSSSVAIFFFCIFF